MTLILKKRLFSSPAAFALTLEAHVDSERHRDSSRHPAQDGSCPSADRLS